jgi:hypothetical protein
MNPFYFHVKRGVIDIPLPHFARNQYCMAQTENAGHSSQDFRFYIQQSICNLVTSRARAGQHSNPPSAVALLQRTGCERSELTWIVVFTIFIDIIKINEIN